MSDALLRDPCVPAQLKMCDLKLDRGWWIFTKKWDYAGLKCICFWTGNGFLTEGDATLQKIFRRWVRQQAVAEMFLIQGSLKGPEIMPYWKLLAWSICKVSLATQRESLAFEGPLDAFLGLLTCQEGWESTRGTMRPVVGTVHNELAALALLHRASYWLLFNCKYLLSADVLEGRESLLYIMLNIPMDPSRKRGQCRQQNQPIS